MIKLAGKIIDQYDDAANELGFDLSKLPAQLMDYELLKEAAYTEPERFALEIIDKGKIHKKYPYDNPVDAYSSAWYLQKVATELPDSAVRKVAAILLDALEPYKVDDALTRWLKKVATVEQVKAPVRVFTTTNEPNFHSDEQVKLASKLTYEERKELPDSAFALVKKDPEGGKIRKYPLHDENHVRAAIVFFAKHYDKLSPEDREKVARKIKQKAEEYGIQISDDSAVAKYASSELQPGFYDELYMRMKLAKPSARQLYEELFKVAQDFNPPALEVGKVLAEIDEVAGLRGKVSDPFEAVYKPARKLEKTAARQPNISEELAKFIKNAPDVWNELSEL